MSGTQGGMPSSNPYQMPQNQMGQMGQPQPMNMQGAGMPIPNQMQQPMQQQPMPQAVPPASNGGQMPVQMGSQPQYNMPQQGMQVAPYRRSQFSRF